MVWFVQGTQPGNLTNPPHHLNLETPQHTPRGLTTAITRHCRPLHTLPPKTPARRRQATLESSLAA